jgi:hypothetical protein
MKKMIIAACLASPLSGDTSERTKYRPDDNVR